MKTRLHVAAPEHEVAYQDIVALVRKHGEHLSAVEMLAIAANMLGKLCAMQDQRSLTPAMVMEHRRAEMSRKVTGRRLPISSRAREAHDQKLTQQ